MKRVILSKFINICSVFILSYGSAIAESKQPLSLEELRGLEITTANKTPVAVKDIPASVTVITRKEIERYGYITLSDIIRNIPGMYLLDNTESLFIGTRGIEGGGIEFLVNGISQHPSLQKVITATNINKFNIPVESIDRIEVIRGPMSVLYGNNAFQGVINIITNNAASQGSMASASIGTDGVSRQFARYAIEEKEYHIVINAGRYTTDGLSGDYKDMLSTEQLSTLHPASDTKIDGRVPKEEKSFGLSASYGNLELNVRHNEMHFGIYAATPGINNATYLNLETTHAAISYSTYLNPYWKWKLSGIYSQEEYNIPSFHIISHDFTGYQNQTSRRQELESTLVYSNSALKSIFGYRYRYIDDVKNDANLYISGSLIQGQLHNLKPYSTHELYSQINYEITSEWSVTGGLRYSHNPEQFESNIFSKTDDTTDLLSVDTDSTDKLSGRLAVMYQANNHHSLRAIAGNAVQYRERIEISDPERITSYELQYIVSYPDVQLQSSFFYQSISNIVQREVILEDDGSSHTNLTNNGEWETVGVEFVGSVQFGNHWRGSGSLVYQKSKDENFDIPIGYSPKVTAKLKTDYIDGSMSYGLNIIYVGDMEAGYILRQETDASTIVRIGEKVDDYFLVGANIRYAPNAHFYLNLKADNLFDETYHHPANEIASMEKGLIGMGRVLMLSVGYKF